MLARLVIGRLAANVALIVALILAPVAAVGARASEAPPLTGTLAKLILHEAPRPLPAIAFQGAEGEPLDLAAVKGKVVLLNLWATWCAPCIQEMPALDRLQARLGERGFEVLAISLDRGGARLVKPFYEKAGLKALGIYLDPTSKIASALGARGLPTSLLLDRDGREIGRLEGEADWDAPEAVALIEYLLKQRQE
jgi:thiol-disulfide isomerase/thioredoxin